MLFCFADQPVTHQLPEVGISTTTHSELDAHTSDGLLLVEGRALLVVRWAFVVVRWAHVVAGLVRWALARRGEGSCGSGTSEVGSC